MRNIRANTSTEDIINLAKMGPAVLAEWRANRSGPRQSTSGGGRFLGLFTKHKLTPHQIVVDTVLADSASERSSTAVATISSHASFSDARQSATVISEPQPKPPSSSSPPHQVVQVTQTGETVKVEDVEMIDAVPNPVPISTPRLVAPLPSMAQHALALAPVPVPVPVPTPAPVVVAARQAMASVAQMTVAPPAPLPQTSIPHVDLDPDVDQAIIYELRDKTMTEIFTLKQDNAKATSTYAWTMRSHAFE
jgi:hypothetical protein